MGMKSDDGEMEAGVMQMTITFGGKQQVRYFSFRYTFPTHMSVATGVLPPAHTLYSFRFWGKIKVGGLGGGTI